uniref:Uncharacterized protein n=1 Tax=uncultured bacterium contig00086 TaxID=1181559 RepID=A0A806KRF9_9BACT|nr:hypothetical protein [uncultured bacterium contig00086]
MGSWNKYKGIFKKFKCLGIFLNSISFGKAPFYCGLRGG